MDEIIRIEDKAHCLLNKQCDRLKKLWGEGTYLTILHSIVVYVLALKANILEIRYGNASSAPVVTSNGSE